MADTTPTSAEDMATRLQANALGTIGTDLFIDFEPVNLPNSVIVIAYNTGGFDPDTVEGKTFDRPTVQIIVIGPIDDPFTAQRRTQAIKELLHTTRFIVGTTRYAGAFLQGDMVPLKKRDSLNWSWDFIAYFEWLSVGPGGVLDDEVHGVGREKRTFRN